MKYKGYINYFLDGVLKTYHFAKATKSEVEALIQRFKGKEYKLIGIKKTTDDDI